MFNSDNFENKVKLGEWSKDESGLPCFYPATDGRLAPYHPFPHIFGTGRATVLADRWGNVNFLTTEGGTTALYPNTTRTRSGLYAVIKKDEEISLLFSETKENRFFRYGVGFAEYVSEINRDSLHIKITQTYATVPDNSTYFRMFLKIENLSDEETGDFELTVRSDISYSIVVNHKNSEHCGEGYGYITTDFEDIPIIFAVGKNDYSATFDAPAVKLKKTISIDAGKAFSDVFIAGYTKEFDFERMRNLLTQFSLLQISENWRRRLQPVLNLKSDDQWMNDEAVWCFSQLIAYSCYDTSVNEYLLNIGGYGEFPNTNGTGFCGFAIREAAETAIACVDFDAEMAKTSLKWCMKIQWRTGLISGTYNMRRFTAPYNQRLKSDSEIWFVMSCMNYVRVTGDYAFFDEVVPFYEGGEATVWEHIRLAYDWIMNKVGTGRHGLIRICSGDWNDYLSGVGKKGFGESVMNSGMACLAFSMFAEEAEKRNDILLASDLNKTLSGLRTAVANSFDKEWFIRDFDDDGNPIGSTKDDRLFINAQSWAVLGGCGTKEQRRKALKSAIEKCHTDYGLCLVSRPFSSPAPDNISTCPIPAGEGENGAIWPQTVHWMIWALVSEGMIEEAENEWKSVSLRNHSIRSDAPYFVINGPDCTNSKFAGEAEGWTQVQVFNRVVEMPMNPSVAWQAFSLKKILDAKRQ